MSLILKGIDLPTNGETLIVGIYGNGLVSMEYTKPLALAIEINAEAIQIPKGHGRLIDGDALTGEMSKAMDMQDTYLPIHFKEWVIDNAPTILGKERE